MPGQFSQWVIVRDQVHYSPVDLWGNVFSSLGDLSPNSRFLKAVNRGDQYGVGFLCLVGHTNDATQIATHTDTKDQWDK